MNRDLRDRLRSAVLLIAVGWLLGSAGTLLGAAAGKPPSPADAVATVGGQPITVEAFQRQMQRRGGDRAGQFSTLEQKKALLQEMLRYQVYAAKARQAGYDKEREFVERVERMLAAKYQHAELDDQLEKLTASPDEVQSYYDEHKAELSTPSQARGAMILFKLPKDAPKERKAEVEKRAQQALDEAKKLAPADRGFGAVAVKYSEDQASRYQGGDLGWLSEGETRYRWPDAVTAAIFAIEQPGKTGPLVRTEDGLYLVRLLEKKAGGPRPLDQVREVLEQQILHDKRSALRQQLYEKASKDVPIEVHESVLEAIPAPRQAEAPEKEGPPPAPGG